jgi:hypothetical protein
MLNFYLICRCTIYSVGYNQEGKKKINRHINFKPKYTIGYVIKIGINDIEIIIRVSSTAISAV